MRIRLAEWFDWWSDSTIEIKGNKKGPMIEYVEDGNIYMEPITKEVINDIRI